MIERMLEKLFEKLKLWHIVVIAVIVYLLALNGRISAAGDDSRYILMSKALLEKGVFRQLLSLDILATQNTFYFILPLLLAPIVAVSPYLFLAMKLIPLSAGICFTIALYQFLEGMVSPRMRKLVVLLSAVNPWIVEYSARVLTDVPYLFFSIMTLLLMKRYMERSSARFLYFSVLMAMVSFYTRPAGVALLAAIIIVLMLSKRWKNCFTACALALILLMPILRDTNHLAARSYNAVVQKEDHYSSQDLRAKPSQLLYRIGYNFLVYSGSYLPDIVARPVAESVDPRLPTKKINPLFPAKFAFGVFMGGIMLVGFIASVKGGGLAMYHFYAVILFLLMLPLNVYVARYLIPLIPFIILWFFIGIDRIAGRYLYTPFFIFFLAVSIVGTAQGVVASRTGAMTAKEKSFVECNEWIKAHIPPDAVVLSRKPYYTKLVTGRKTVPYLFSDDPARQFEYIITSKARYVIVGDLGFYLNEAAYLINTVKKYPDNFRLLYTTGNKPENYVYEAVY